MVFLGPVGRALSSTLICIPLDLSLCPEASLFFFFFEVGFCYVAQFALKPAIFMPLPPKCWDYRCAPPYPAVTSFFYKNKETVK
jgi:hypothetical protein